MRVKTFVQLFFKPVADSDHATRRHLLWWILLRMLQLGLLCGTAAILRDRISNAIVPPMPQTSLFLLALYLFSLFSAFILKKSVPSGWKLRAFGLFQLWTDALVVALVVYASGCSASIFTPLFILPIIAAGLILYKTGGLFLAATSSFLYAGILALELSGKVPAYFFAAAYELPQRFTDVLNLFAFYGLLFFLAALISGQMGSRLHQTQKELSQTTRAYEQLALLYQQIFNDISTGIITTDGQDRINSYNPAAALITGYSQAEVMGQSMERCFPAMAHSSALPPPRRSVCSFTKLSGEQIRIGYSFTRLNLATEKGEQQDASRARVITLQDISQVERMEQQMREAEQLAAIGEMSAQIAHDFRNPLTAISGSAQMLAMNEENDRETAATLVSIIIRETARMERTIADFLLFARPRAPQSQWFALRELLERQRAHLIHDNQRFAPIEIRQDIPEALLCWADQEQLGVILLHLLENACMAVQESAASVLVRARQSGAGDMLLIEVCDQGPGIAPELREQVFKPFFSNRANGTGLGLAIVRQLIQRHEGRVSIDDDAEFGCIVRLELPQPRQALTG